MREPLSLVYIHLVWATWDRLPLITDERENIVHASIRSECEGLKAGVVALGGIEDHIHLLAHVPSTLDVARLVKRIKGASSHLVNERSTPELFFKWQGAYGSFSISPWDVTKVQRYILNQKKHHHLGTIKPIFEQVEITESAKADFR